MNKKPTIAIIGLGYVGLPLAVALAENYKIIGFDINQKRTDELQNGKDSTNEVDTKQLKQTNILFTCLPTKLTEADIIIVTVPTPIDNAKQPDLTPIIKASETIGQHLKKDTIIVYESTVYPGVTEDTCVPIFFSKISLLDIIYTWN